jgi:hypothetical protein
VIATAVLSATSLLSAADAVDRTPWAPLSSAPLYGAGAGANPRIAGAPPLGDPRKAGPGYLGGDASIVGTGGWRDGDTRTSGPTGTPLSDPMLRVAPPPNEAGPGIDTRTAAVVAALVVALLLVLWWRNG